MNKGANRDLEFMRRTLVARRAEVLASIRLEENPFAHSSRVGEDDLAQRSHDEYISLHLNRIDYEQLRLVEEALDRMDAGDYGLCLGCEEPIPLKRLRAVPWARYCLPCQELGSGAPAQKPNGDSRRG